MTLLRHAIRLTVRERRRTLAAVVGVAIASALITSVLAFGAASGATVTRRALADLPVDAQLELPPGIDATAAIPAVRSDPAVLAVVPFDLAHFDAAESTNAGTATQASAGVLVGIDSTYPRTTGLFALSAGTLRPGSVAISRDLASNLGVVPGDSLSLTLAGGATVTLPVSGIVAIDRADLLLGPIDTAHRAAGANPPTSVAVMDRQDLERMILPKIPAGATAADAGSATGAGANPSGAVASAAPSSVGSSVPVTTGEPAVRRELHLRFDHEQLPGDPVAAQTWLDMVRRRIERVAAGGSTIVDDASAALEPLAPDLAWGQILFIFLALPGVALALALSRMAADALADTTRRHAALLRARGATPRDLWIVFVGSTIAAALLGSILGAVATMSIGFLAFRAALTTPGIGDGVLRSLGLAIALTTILASIAAVVPLRDQLGSELAGSRSEVRRTRPALWQRLYLDVLALIAGITVDIVAGGSVRPVLDPEGNPTVTLALTSFVAPFLFWIGATLLLLRVARRLSGRSGRLARALRRVLGPGGALAAASFAARPASASRAIVVVALAISFATSVAIFDATYRQQQRVDAELTLGADLKAIPANPVGPEAAHAALGPGVLVATPFVDRVVYVGPEAQDLLAVDPSGLAAVAPLSDTFFQGTSASAALDALRSRPDAILVSAETARDYSMVPGDRVRIRVPDAKGNLIAVDFHMAGVALEFPTAPKDAFLVANLSYLAQASGDSHISFVLARADGGAHPAATRLAARLGDGWQVQDLSGTTARLANSITSVDLAGLVAIDIGFAILIAAIGATLFLLAGLAERRRELATLVAVGAEPGQLRRSVLGETSLVGAAGLAGGLTIGGAIALALLQLLAGVFDPPADVPVLPMPLLLAIVVSIVAALAVAVAVAAQGVARIGVVEALRER